jgi:hypothetical protein
LIEVDPLGVFRDPVPATFNPFGVVTVIAVPAAVEVMLPLLVKVNGKPGVPDILTVIGPVEARLTPELTVVP